jgi:DNA repair/transcription protein MET18/MMS19
MAQFLANTHLLCAPSRVAALEASGTLATLYPGAFSSHLVPKLAKEINRGMYSSSGPAFTSKALGAFMLAITQGNLISWLLAGDSDLTRDDGPTKCSQYLRCLQVLSAISTHASIVKETLPLLLQHLWQVNKGNYQESSSIAGLNGECIQVELTLLSPKL